MKKKKTRKVCKKNTLMRENNLFDFVFNLTLSFPFLVLVVFSWFLYLIRSMLMQVQSIQLVQKNTMFYKNTKLFQLPLEQMV